MRTVLFLGASVSQVEAIRRARQAGLRVVAIDGDVDAVAFADADVAEVVDFSDVDRVIGVARRHHVDGVLAVSTDRAVPVAAAVAAALGLPGIGPDVARAMTNKATMRERLDAAGVRQPAHALVRTAENASGVFDEVGLPAVVKPVDSGGQRGVFIVRSANELAERLSEVLRFSRCGEAIVETYVEGPELNGIVVVTDGEPHLVTLSDRLRPPGLGFGVGWVHLYPSLLPRDELRDAAAVAEQAVAALGLRDGIAFPQLIVSPAGTHVVEVAARIPAGQMADLVRIGTGVDLVQIALEIALGRSARDLWQPKFEQSLAIRFFTASPGLLPVGRIAKIEGIERVRAAPGVAKAELYMRPGETINPVHVDADRRGYVIAVANDPAHALELADIASRELDVEVEPPRSWH